MRGTERLLFMSLDAVGVSAGLALRRYLAGGEDSAGWGRAILSEDSKGRACTIQLEDRKARDRAILLEDRAARDRAIPTKDR